MEENLEAFQENYFSFENPSAAPIHALTLALLPNSGLSHWLLTLEGGCYTQAGIPQIWNPVISFWGTRTCLVPHISGKASLWGAAQLSHCKLRTKCLKVLSSSWSHHKGEKPEESVTLPPLALVIFSLLTALSLAIRTRMSPMILINGRLRFLSHSRRWRWHTCLELLSLSLLSHCSQELCKATLPGFHFTLCIGYYVVLIYLWFCSLFRIFSFSLLPICIMVVLMSLSLLGYCASFLSCHQLSEREMSLCCRQFHSAKLPKGFGGEGEGKRM